MRADDFTFLSQFIKGRSGIELAESKIYLLENRLTPVARRHGLADLSELVNVLRKKTNPALATEVTDAMTTNESFFFRDTKPFDYFRQHALPALLERKKNQKSFRIWCAAASSGQEPYSLAMILKEESAKLAGWRHEIVATDISNQILSKAKAGLYTQFEVQRGLPVQLLTKYFSKQGDQWEIDSSIKSMVNFKEFNLLGQMAALGKFDIVFCRNVLIYFDHQTKSDILRKISEIMLDDSMLALGAAETTLGLSTAFSLIPGTSGIYTPNRPTKATTPPLPADSNRSMTCPSIQT